MSSQATHIRNLPLWLGGLVAVLVSGIAIGSLAISGKMPQPDLPSAIPRDATLVVSMPRSRPKCMECGVVESTQELPSAVAIDPSRSDIDAQSPHARMFQITIRMHDGSTQLIKDSDVSHWRRGERVKIIAGKV